MRYPEAERADVVDHLHGREVPDPYRWLEDPMDPRSLVWSAAQDQLAREHLQGLAGRRYLREVLTGLHAAGSVTAPVWRGERGFATRRRPGEEQPVLVMRDAEGVIRTLVDPGLIDPGGRVTLDDFSPNWDGSLVAYLVSGGGDEESLLRVLDTTTGEVVDGPLGRVRYSPVAWEPGTGAFYYARKLAPAQVPPGEEQLHRRLWRHVVGEDPETDTLVFGEGLPAGTYFGAETSADGRWLVVTTQQGTDPRSDVYLADLATTRGPLAVSTGEDARTTAWVAHDGRLYLLTTRDAARGRLCVADPEQPTQWHELVAEDPEAVLEAAVVLDDAVVLTRTRHSVGELAVHDRLTGEPRWAPPLPGNGELSGLTARPHGGGDAWVSYCDELRPSTVLRIDVARQQVRVWEDAPGGVPRLTPTPAAEQHVCQSTDGTQVRVRVLRPATPGPYPTVLFGYGGFGISLTPAYNRQALAWVAAGGAWATVHLRGGGEAGEDWHRAGMRARKESVFQDCAAAARYLRSCGLARTVGLVGRSNGGLLVGAELTRNPGLYDAAVCGAPLLDMVRYELSGLGPTWTGEYGSAAVPEELDWLLGYSPYHHVTPGTRYPATLFTVFNGDTRVDPMHARKTCAALQHAQAGPGPVLLRAEDGVGHLAPAVNSAIELAVDTLAFLAHHLGLELPG
ncbi:MAG: prolyl oligopeptidase family serine peptidase [Mycobacteriales bacterium]